MNNHSFFYWNSVSARHRNTIFLSKTKILHFAYNFNMKKHYILFIDSGIGGLTTLCKCIKILPANYLYYADNNNAPYGNHNKTEIFNYLKSIISSLLEIYDIKIVVLACNTATTSAITKLRKTFNHITFIGTEPAIKLAEKLGFKNILCAVTPATLKQNKFKMLDKSLNAKTRHYASKTLAKSIESYYTNKSILNYFNLTKEIYSLARISKQYDCLVLGCTHYIFIKDKLKNLTRKPIIDGNIGTSKQLQKIYEILSPFKPSKLNIKFFVSNDKICPNEIYEKIFQETLAKV